jgi:hypothetical protein
MESLVSMLSNATDECSHIRTALRNPSQRKIWLDLEVPNWKESWHDVHSIDTYTGVLFCSTLAPVR